MLIGLNSLFKQFMNKLGENANKMWNILVWWFLLGKWTYLINFDIILESNYQTVDYFIGYGMKINLQWWVNRDLNCPIQRENHWFLLIIKRITIYCTSIPQFYLSLVLFYQCLDLWQGLPQQYLLELLNSLWNKIGLGINHLFCTSPSHETSYIYTHNLQART